MTWSYLWGPLLTAWAVFGNALTPEDILSDGSSWHKPGCHLLGHSRTMSIPGCTKFPVVTNACRGYCPSISMPAAYPAPRPVTSLAHCCSIMESRPLTVKILCLEGERNITVMSATSCSCYHCHKD